MIVIADTTPLNYLVLIGEISVLASLYGSVVIPTSVHEELRNPLAPLEVQTWIEKPPGWLSVQSPGTVKGYWPSKLDRGERDAIALAEELAANQLIIDEMFGRTEARRRGLSVIGTLGVLRDAAGAGLLDLELALGRLRSTSFHVSREILSRLLKDSL